MRHVGRHRYPDNPLSKIPARARQALYIVYAVAGPLLVYTASRGWTGDAEYALYVGIGTALGLTAASNIEAADPAEDDDPAGDDPALGERILLDEDEVTRGVAQGPLHGMVQGEPFDPDNRYRNFGN